MIFCPVVLIRRKSVTASYETQEGKVNGQYLIKLNKTTYETQIKIYNTFFLNKHN